jgi:hypothetical protein
MTTSEKSRDYRIIYANRFGLRTSDNDFGLLLGNDTVVEAVPQITHEAYVAMTPRGAKILARMLADAVKNFEAQFGEISIPELAFTTEGPENITKQ